MVSRGINNPDQTIIKRHILGHTGLDCRLESHGRAPVFQCLMFCLKDIRVPFRHRSTQWVGEFLVYLDVFALV